MNIESNKQTTNWPVVYLLRNNKEIYIGETNHFIKRMKQHYNDPKKQNLNMVHLITDADLNKSAIVDIESALIGYFDADKRFEILNSNAGFANQNYFNKPIYKNKIPLIWRKLQEKQLADKEIFQLENTDLFKYSPYKTLSENQYEAANMILKDCLNKKKSISFIEGNPGTGKTILAIYLLKILILAKAKENKSVALVVPMTSLRKTLGKVAKSSNGLKSLHVIGPADATKKKYDVLIVDEAHRLKRRVNITNNKSFDDINIELDLPTGTQLDWVIASSEHTILFYDEGQSIKPTDVRKEDFSKLKEEKKQICTEYELKTQHRVEGGEEFISYVKSIMNNVQKNRKNFPKYDSRVFDSFRDFNQELSNMEKQYELVRMVAGYSFKWISKKDSSKFDIVIEGIEKKWNSESTDWVNSPNAKDEVGCIHTVQGYDLNYIGVIFGYEIDYDFNTKEITVDKKSYYDIKGKSSINSENELKEYIKNIYTTLMTRGIKGIYMYACNANFNKYLKKYFN